VGWWHWPARLCCQVALLTAALAVVYVAVKFIVWNTWMAYEIARDERE
jgi:hypothetical protein